MSRQTGFALPSAIFLLVILALLGAFMLTLSNTQHLTRPV
jgi:Tfp pilus assembly protein PilX